jgi:tetratricopeptide (TPR) repeat protein
VITEGLEAGTLEPDGELWELLANAWLSAREYDRALDPLEEAARASGDGKLYVRLEQVHLEREEWKKAQAALRSGLSKGGLDDPSHVHLLLGISSFRQRQLDQATEHFTRAQQSEKSRRAATQWLRHVEGAKQRLELGS